MARIRNPLPFPFASAREKHAHRMNTGSVLGMDRNRTIRAVRQGGRPRQRSSVHDERYREAEEGFAVNEAFFRGQNNGCSYKGKTPAMRLKKKVKGLNLEALDGLTTPPAQPRMRIRSSNAKRHIATTMDWEPTTTNLVIDSSALLILALYVAILFVLHPLRTVQLILMGLMFFAHFPEWMPWWTALLTLMLPVGLQARFEVTVALCMVVWLGELEWGEAWGRVVRWVWEA